MLQKTEIVGAVVELKLARLVARRVELRLQLGTILLQVFRLFLQRHTGQECILSVVALGDHHGRKILVFKGHPVGFLINLLVQILFLLVQVIGTSVGKVIGKSRALVLEVESALLLAAPVGPLDVHQVVIRCKHTAHALGLKTHAQQVVVIQRVVQHQLLAFSGCGRHRNGGVGHVRGREKQVRSDDVGFFSCQHELQVLVVSVEERHILVALEVLEVLHDGFLHHSALGGQGQLKFSVFQHHFLGCTTHGFEKGSCSVLLGGGRFCLR